MNWDDRLAGAAIVAMPAMLVALAVAPRSDPMPDAEAVRLHWQMELDQALAWCADERLDRERSIIQRIQCAGLIERNSPREKND